MKLCCPRDLAFRPEQVVFRQSRLAGTMGMLVLGTLFVAAGPVWWLLGAPWFIWGPCLAVALLVLRICSGSITALYRKTNWVLAIDQNALWVNLRSPLNYHLPEGQTAVCLELSELANVSIYSEGYSTPAANGGSTRRAMKSIQFKLTHTDTQGLVTALEQERKQEPVPRRFLGMSSSSRANHYPVSVPEPGIIRIAWRGSTMEDHVSPAAERAIGLLGAAGVPIHQAALTERADWAQLDGPELDALVRTLARSGNSIEAAKLLCQRRGLTLTEAKRQVEEIAASR